MVLMVIKHSIAVFAFQISADVILRKEKLILTIFADNHDISPFK